MKAPSAFGADPESEQRRCIFTQTTYAALRDGESAFFYQRDSQFILLASAARDRRVVVIAIETLTTACVRVRVVRAAYSVAQATSQLASPIPCLPSFTCCSR